jgi:DNA-binding response OmpR family regulator
MSTATSTAPEFHELIATNRTPARVLIADDEPPARRRLRTLLANHPDFEIVGESADGESAVADAQLHRPDLVFLDVQMPGLDGIAVARLVEQSAAPMIVFVTAFDQYAVQAFEVHAVDYLLKPYDEERFERMLNHVRERMNVVHARDSHTRLLAVLQELEGNGISLDPPNQTIRVADIRVDAGARRVQRDGDTIVLRRKEYEVLIKLMSRPGEVVTKRELLQDVFGYKEDVVSRTLDTHIFELRRKLGHEHNEAGYIETIAGVGYRIVTDGDSRHQK